MPFGDEAIGGKRCVQRTGGNSIGVRQVTPCDRPKAHKIKVGILGHQGVEGPFDEADVAAKGVIALEEF